MRPGGGTTTYLGNVQSLQSAWQRDKQHTTETKEESGERNNKKRRKKQRGEERQGEKVVTKELGCSLSIQHSQLSQLLQRLWGQFSSFCSQELVSSNLILGAGLS